ncbi:hypothetical protein [Micromonospora mirobrigensis]|uniref:Uncharacterized protein n=1 Tax=Micromonospora mirobrigensis TaxID=262898 RepID=A0A1C4XYG9_9ACTN|nr:hypothetical protein [Micromonospora mirobrigensis]SCF13529.1 hypothetical protein GA0070564_103425 [Micromonospora mirobrigensis]
MKRKPTTPLRLLWAALTAVTLVLLGGQAPAMASLPSDYSITTSVILHGSSYSESYSRTIVIRNGRGEKVGDGEFRADPLNGSPGDALGACDDLADGLGVEIRMDIGSSSGFYSTDRIASTRGRNSPTCTGWVTGDIAENTPVALKVCLVSGSLEYCSGVYYARA